MTACHNRRMGEWLNTRYQCLPAYDTCRLVGVAWQVLGPPPGLEVLDRGEAVVRPEGYDIPEDVVGIHGITNEAANQARHRHTALYVLASSHTSSDSDDHPGAGGSVAPAMTCPAPVGPWGQPTCGTTGRSLPMFAHKAVTVGTGCRLTRACRAHWPCREASPSAGHWRT